MSNTLKIWRHPLTLTAVAALVIGGSVAGLTRFVNNDLEHQSRLVNFSSRGPIGTGPECLLSAFVIAERTQTVVVRARGWTQAAPGAPEVPRAVRLRVVRHADGLDVGRNEGWRSAGNERLWGDLKHLAPAEERQPACVMRLEPGGYSAFLENIAGEGGVGSLELFVIQR